MRRIVKLEQNRANELAILNKQLIDDEGHANPMNIEQLGDRMSKWLESDYSCHAIEENGEIICYGLWRDDGDFYYLRHLFTQRLFRRKGYAKELIAYLEGKVLTDKPIRLEVLSGNEAALKFYKCLGYESYSYTLLKPVNNQSKKDALTRD